MSTGLTTFYNSKQRMIYTGHRGGMYVVSKNRKVYGVKAHFKKTTGGAMVSLEVKRRTRRDKGVARKKKAVGSPVMSILQNPYIRKTRKDAGTKKGPRKPKALGKHTRFMYSPNGTMMM